MEVNARCDELCYLRVSVDCVGLLFVFFLGGGYLVLKKILVNCIPVGCLNDHYFQLFHFCTDQNEDDPVQM